MHVVPSLGSNPADHPRRIGLLSTYPPQLCGLATYAHALEQHLDAEGHEVRVVAVHESLAESVRDTPRLPALVAGSAHSQRQTVAVLDECDVALVQHEFGIFSGPDGADVLDVLADLCVPIVVTLHTVPLQPTAGQRSVLAALALFANRLIVMTEAARVRLVDLYGIPEDQAVTIPHGATVPTGLHSVGRSESMQRGPLLTWGLLGPGKGIEHVIDAIALLSDRPDVPPYVVAGLTHPKVFERDGASYLDSLRARARSRGVAARVQFDGTYRDVASLTRFVASASVVVLPYDSREQATSGVLVDAIAAGRPVIATSFPHAVEVLGSGAGIVVPHENPAALAAAIALVFGERGRLEAMAAEAHRLAPTYAWPAVARRYEAVFDEIVVEAGSAAR